MTGNMTCHFEHYDCCYSMF